MSSGSWRARAPFRTGQPWAERARTMLAALVVAACSAPRHAPGPVDGNASGKPFSNITRADFASSEACAGCHEEIFDKWRRSPMHRMTRHMQHGVAQAPFDGSTFRFKNDVATMITKNDQRYMHLESAKYPSAWYRITKVIGGRYREDYAGVQVGAPELEAADASDERILPVSYLLFNKTWRYKGYSVMSPERNGLRRGLKWKTACVFCHNTVPWISMYYDELYGVGAPGFQGAASLILPSERRLAYRVTDPTGFFDAVTDELEVLGAEAPVDDEVSEVIETAARATRARFDEKHLIEVGIGCEACHGGARAHAAQPSLVLPQYTPSSPFMSTSNASGEPVPKALSISHSCAKCHTVLFSRYPYTWEGGERGFDAGGSSMNSGEARNFLLGGCVSAMGCATCHDPHGADEPAKARMLETVEGNAVCTNCHKDKQSSAALARHSHHAPRSQGSACVACHMPKKNVALDYDLTRYHRIGSPTDEKRVERDRPLECALCHADKNVDELVTLMQRWWGKKYDRDALRQLYGENLAVNTLIATLERGKPHEQVVALHGLGRAKRTDARELVTKQLDNAYPLLRFFARDALERISGVELDVDMHLPGPKLEALVRRQLAEHELPTLETTQRGPLP